MEITISNIKLGKDELLPWAEEIGQHAEEAWINSIAVSVIEWFDENDSISIKTSGSTGQPKVIRLSKEAMQASAILTGKRFGLTEGMSTINCLPAQYVAGKMMVIRALVLGLNQICVEPKLSIHIASKATIDFVAMTPMQLEQTLNNHPDQIGRIKTIILGGAPIPTDLMTKIQKLTTQCHATYGMTETITHIATRPVNGPFKSDSFEALKGVHFRRKEGCLIIHADHLIDSPLFTTDEVTLIDHQHFIWLGRKDNVINSGGVKIHPELIERQLQSKIKDRFFMAGMEDAQSGQRPVLLIESEIYDTTSMARLNSDLNVLEKLQRPKKIIFASTFYETPTGKIKRDIKLYDKMNNQS